MNQQNNYTSYSSNYSGDSLQKTEYVQNPPDTMTDGQFNYNASYSYPPSVNPEEGTGKILGLLSVIFSSVGLACCGIQFSLIGLIVGIVAMVQSKKSMQKSGLGLAGVILGGVSLVLYLVLLIAYFSVIITSLASIGGEFDSLF